MVNKPANKYQIIQYVILSKTFSLIISIMIHSFIHSFIQVPGPFHFSNLLQSLYNQLCHDSIVSFFWKGL